MKQIVAMVMVCLLCSGCQSMFKKQPLLAPARNLSNPEKVWVEAQTRKVWTNPYVDDNGDMVDGHYKYVVVAPGHWAVKGEKR